MREIVREGASWRVFEADATHTPGAHAARCLIFDSDGIVRRAWVFPVGWSTLDDDTLWAMVDTPALVPRPTPTFVARSAPTPRRPDLSLLAAAADVTARTRSLLAELQIARCENQALLSEQRELLDQCRGVRGEMRRTVEAYAMLLRGGGVPCERALVLIKSAVLDGLGGADGVEEPGAEQLMHDGVAWGIAAYFAA